MRRDDRLFGQGEHFRNRDIDRVREEWTGMVQLGGDGFVGRPRLVAKDEDLTCSIVVHEEVTDVKMLPWSTALVVAAVGGSALVLRCPTE